MTLNLLSYLTNTSNQIVCHRPKLLQHSTYKFITSSKTSGCYIIFAAIWRLEAKRAQTTRQFRADGWFHVSRFIAGPAAVFVNKPEVVIMSFQQICKLDNNHDIVVR